MCSRIKLLKTVVTSVDLPPDGVKLWQILFSMADTNRDYQVSGRWSELAEKMGIQEIHVRWHLRNLQNHLVINRDLNSEVDTFFYQFPEERPAWYDIPFHKREKRFRPIEKKD